MQLPHFAGRSSISHHIKIRVDPSGYIYFAILILLIPGKWLISALIAAAVHELGHILCLYLLRVRIIGIQIGVGGAVIHTSQMPAWKELLSSASGPVSGLLLMLLFSLFPRIAFCACIQTVFNLLPVFPFDGWRIMRSAVISVYEGWKKISTKLALDKYLSGDKLK